MTTAIAVTCITFITVIQINTLQSYAENSISTANPNITASNLTELEMLKKEKEELLESLMEAVEDTKGYIWQNNGTTSLTNLTNIKEMFENYLSNSTPWSGGRSPELSIDRRQAGRNYSQFFQLLTAAKGKHKKREKNHKERELQRIIMQGKIDEWLLNRELKKKNYKSYISKVKTNDKLENCPREGVSRKKKKNKFRRAGDSTEEEKQRQMEEKRKNKKTKKKKGEKKYPCCRKCCKRSYMGCL